MAQSHFDLLVVGAGQAAVPLAVALAKEKWRVGVAERAHLGGSCVNFGCTPTKAALASAHVAHMARRAADFGVTIPTVEPDFAAVMARARAIRDNSRESLAAAFQGARAPTLLRGHARFTGRDGDFFRLEIAGEAGLRTVTA
ncbi:MAG TPA: FAD-dependent oxidoreductase, partial [Rhodothermales bacterium]|nr:FAD-dependent oxidoreductase [Rhodothermales bacterium]